MRRHIQLPKGRLDALRLSAMQRHYRQTWGPGRTPKLVLFKFQTDGRSSVRRSGSLSAQCPSRSSERKKSSSTTELTDAICDELMMLLCLLLVLLCCMCQRRDIWSKWNGVLWLPSFHLIPLWLSMGALTRLHKIFSTLESYQKDWE